MLSTAARSALSPVLAAACLAVICLTVTCWTVALAAPGGKPARPLRLGIHHPHPALCPWEEPSQRDLRVLRLAFDTGRSPAQWAEWPWFYRALPHRDAMGKGTLLMLDRGALWGAPSWSVLNGPAPEFPLPNGDPLAAWRKAIAGAMGAARGGMATAPWIGTTFLRVPSGNPYFSTLLARSDLLPISSGGAGVPNGIGVAFPRCRNWPLGVGFEAAGEEERQRLVYRLQGPPAGRGKPYVLYGYRNRRALWRAYLLGRLDALLLEGADFNPPPRRLNTGNAGVWGAYAGGQQVVLRFSPRLLKNTTPMERELLSMALNRRGLAALEGPGHFFPAAAFLAPLPNGVESGFPWNTRHARREWLRLKTRPGPQVLGAPRHPALNRIAEQIQAQWSRTLNFSLSVTSYPVHQFQGALERWETGLVLDVVDLDDGSLQALWMTAVDPEPSVFPASPGDEGRVMAGEAGLRQRLGYLPLLVNSHYVLLRKGAPPEWMHRICPGCRRVPPPFRMRTPRVAPPSPQG